MSVTRVQSAQNLSSGATTLTATFGSATTAGNLLVAAVVRNGGTSITSVKGSDGVSLTQAVALNASAFAAIYYYPNNPGGLTGITLALPFDSCSIQIAEYSGVATSTPLDKTSSHDSGFSPGGTSWTSNATTTLSQTGELIIGYGTEWRTITTTMSAGSGFTQVLRSSDNRDLLEEIIGNATTTGIAATGTLTTFTNGQVYALVATFLPASSAVNVNPSGVSATSGQGTATVSVSESPSPSGVSATSAVGTATALVVNTVTPNGVSATSQVGSPTATGTATASPSGVRATSSVGTATIFADVEVAPSGVSATSAVNTPTATGSGFASPNGVSSTSSLGTASVSAGANISVSGVSATSAHGTATAAASAIILLTGLGMLSAVGSSRATATFNRLTFSSVTASSSLGFASFSVRQDGA